MRSALHWLPIEYALTFAVRRVGHVGISYVESTAMRKAVARQCMDCRSTKSARLSRTQPKSRLDLAGAGIGDMTSCWWNRCRCPRLDSPATGKGEPLTGDSAPPEPTARRIL